MNSLARNISMAFLIQVVGYSVTFILNVLLARWLGAEQYGSFIFFKNTITILSIFGTVGLFGTATKYLSAYVAVDNTAAMRGLMVFSTGITMSVSVVLLVLALIVLGRFSPAEIDSRLLSSFAPILIVMALHVLYSDALRGMGYITLALAPSDILRPLLMLIAFVLIVFTGSLSTLLASLVAFVVSLIVVTFLQMMIAGWRLWRDRAMALSYQIRAWLTFGIESMIVRGNITLRTELTPIIIGYILVGEAIGLFVVAERAAYLTAFFYNAVRRVFEPMIAPLVASGNRDELNHLHISITRWTFYGALSFALLIMVFATPILRLFGAEFVQARPVLGILLFGQVINAATGQAGSILRFAGYELVVRRIMIVTTGLLLVTAILLTYLFGIIGTAIAVSGGVIGQNIAFYVFMQRELGLRLPLRTYWLLSRTPPHA